MRPRHPRSVGWILAALAWALPAHAQGVAGVVVDPQDRRIVGASVAVTCADKTLRTVTDADGRFTLPIEATAPGCTLCVAAPRFRPATIVANPNGDAPAIVRLEVEPVIETIEVRARAADTPITTAGVVLSKDQMRTISDDPAEILRVAKARAGSSAGSAVYVDGLPAQQLPAVSRMASLAVATDPYSSEYSDPGLRRIDVVTVVPDRHWRVDFSGAPGTIDGPSSLGERRHARSLRGGVGGPSPWAGGAFSLQADMDTLEGERAVVAAGPGAGPGVSPRAMVPGSEGAAGLLAPYGTSRRRASLQFHQALTAGSAVRVEASRTVDQTSNAGVGGEVLPEAAQARDGTATELRVTINHDRGKVSWRSQLLGNWSSDASRALSSSPAMQVQGAFVGGGAATSSSARNEERLFWKTVAAAPTARLPWRAGFSVERALEQIVQVPNPAGSIQLSSPEAWHAALEGAAVATTFRSAGSMVQRVALLDAAAFSEATLVQQPGLRLAAGARVDWQSRDRVRLSPRLSAIGQAGAWTLSGGIGLFTRAWQPALFTGTRAAEGTAPVVFMAQHVSLDNAAGGDAIGVPIVMDVAPGLTRARYAMASQAAERPLGRVTIGVEHVWWRGDHLLGAGRLPDPASSGWTDWLESNRRFDSHELRVRVSVGGPNRNASLTYGWIHSKDDSDGPWSFPARQGNIAAEWAPSARVAAHNLDGVVSAALPRGVHLTAIVSLRGGSPYDIVSGLDAEANGLYTDRGGLPRNSGRLGGSRSVTLYLHRRFNLAAVFGPRANVPIDGGFQFDTLLGGSSWTLVGNVIGSPLFGRPESAMSGRSARIWFAVGR